MASLILTKRGLKNHPIFAISETLRPVAPPAPGDDSGAIRQLHAELERLGKSVYRLAISQESMSRELHNALQHSKTAPQNDLQQARRRLAADFFPLIDALHRLAQALVEQDNGALADGARVVAAKGDAYLAALGVEAIPSIGRRFDPHLHRALEARPAPPEMQGCVIDEIVRGYRIGERILRTAQVVVGKEG